MGGKKLMNVKKLLGLGLLAVLALAFPAFAQEVTPSVTVSDQPLLNGAVTVGKVVSVGPGWIVIHAQADGKPGPILGYSPVADGENNDVVVEIDAFQATGTLYAMLHADAGEIGTWEFPGGPDTPVTVNDEVVTPPFKITVGVVVADQPITDGKVTVARVFSAGSGWIVIHAQADGKPGPILGYSQVADGENRDTMVDIDATAATDTLYAMLHVDAGQVGAWEFPGGPDTPVAVGEQVVTPAFQVTAGLPATLPETGGTATAWILVLLAAGGLILVGGFVLRRQAHGASG
jgi:LPXTG-motif cell wall-anchored protein